MHCSRLLPHKFCTVQNRLFCFFATVLHCQTITLAGTRYQLDYFVRSRKKREQYKLDIRHHLDIPIPPRFQFISKPWLDLMVDPKWMLDSTSRSRRKELQLECALFPRLLELRVTNCIESEVSCFSSIETKEPGFTCFLSIVNHGICSTECVNTFL